MKARLELSEHRVKVHIERLKTLITSMQADLDPDYRQFKELEVDYFEWKKKIERKQLAIKEEQDELDTLVHFDKFKDDPKPQLIQQQVVKKKGQKILKNIKWSKLIVPILTNENRFIEQWELFKMTGIEDNKINRMRYYSALAKATERKEAGVPVEYYKYKDRVGLPEWNVISHAKEII